ncbi:MAG: tetratricopeptide repeat protein [Candidatus Brocadia sp.]|nr:tetratricopeptide repeat protein [Candidatus Brocadia sp.]
MKRTLIVVILGISSFLVLMAPLYPREKREDESLLFLMAARNAAKAGWTKKAIRRYENYLKIKPADDIVGLEYADYLQDNGNHRKAEVHYDLLIQKMGTVPKGKEGYAKKLILNAARNAIKNKKGDRATAYYMQALLFDENDCTLAEEVAGVFAGQEKYENALELCDRILLHDPQNRGVTILKINLLMRLKKFAEAQETIAQVPYDERSLKLRQLSADIDAWSGNYDTAIEKYQKLIHQSPDNRELWSQLIKVLSWAKKWSLLLETAQAGKDKIEMNDDTRALLVNAHLSAGEQEKAIEVWKTIGRGSDTWRASALMIVDKLLSQRKLAAALDTLEKIVSDGKFIPEAHLLAKLAILYTYQEMPAKGFEILDKYPVSPQSKPILEATRAEILSLTGRYDDALTIIHTLEGDKETGFRLRMLELECYYALENDRMLLEKSSSLLQKLSHEEITDKAKVLTLRILSQIRIGHYKELGAEIELLSKIDDKDPGPAILTVLLLAAGRQLEANERANQVLGKVLSRFTAETEMIRPQLLDVVPLSAWKIADDVAMHHNPEVCAQRAKAEYKAGNYQQSLIFYTELKKEKNDPLYKLGMVECFLGMNNPEEANNIFHQIPLPGLPEKETTRYLEALVTLKKRKEELLVGLSRFSEDVSQKTSVKAIVAIANVQSGDRATADGIVKQYLSNQPENLALFQTILERIGYFDRGRQSPNYEFAKDWLHQAVEQFPGDSGLRYQYAKLLATHNDYDLASEQFLTLQESDPTDVRCMRWLAQVNAWRHEYEESMRWYDAYLKERPLDFDRRREVARVYGWALRPREANQAYQKLCEDYPEDYEILWEWKAKRNNWLGRKRTAASFYRELAERHPEDSEMLFDLGQMYSQLHLSTPAEEVYQKLLISAPEHNRAQFAQESEQWRCRQSVRLKQSYIHQKGSGDDFGNYEIMMFRTDAAYAPVRLAEAMDLSVGLGNTVFNFTKHSGSVAEHLTLQLNKYFEQGITTYVDGELSTYSENRHETGQFEAGGAYRFYDRFDVTVFGGREDVLQNFNTLENSRGRYYTGGRFAWDISQRIDISSQIKKHWYDDSNNGTEDYTAIGYKLSLHPKILKFVVETYGYDVHARRDEYWSPHDYRKYTGGIVWRHYLGKEHFSGAPKLFYELALRESIDSDSVDYIEPRFEFGWDDQRRWNIGFEMRPVQSKVFEEEQAGIFCNIRF